MQTFSQSIVRAILCSVLFASVVRAQWPYLHQDFQKTTSLVNPLPDSGQFSHIILTAPALSYYKFHKGYMELTRTWQDSASGGIIRVLRATPFEPNPETLFIQITLSAESVQTNSVNALYFYAGENFNPVNNSFPGNGLMFGRFAINFTENGFVVKDPETQSISRIVELKKQITLTWILNNSTHDLPYHLPWNANERITAPGTYDLWVDGEPVHLGSKAYPGNSSYSPTKLSNFEIRYRNGLGRMHIHEIMIREGFSELTPEENVVMPNPAPGQGFSFNAKNTDLATLRLVRQNGQNVSFEITGKVADKIEIRPAQPLAAGLYILSFYDLDRKKRFIRLVVQ